MKLIPKTGNVIIQYFAVDVFREPAHRILFPLAPSLACHRPTETRLQDVPVDRKLHKKLAEIYFFGEKNIYIYDWLKVVSEVILMIGPNPLQKYLANEVQKFLFFN